MKAEIQKTFLSLPKNKHTLTYIRLAGSVITILSGFAPFLDNIIAWKYPEFDTLLDERQVSLRVDVWLISIYLSIALASIGGVMKAYYLTFFLPIYSSLYSMTIYILMMKGVEIDADWIHRLGFVVFLLPLGYVMYRLNNYIKDLKLKDEIQHKTIERIANQNQNHED